MTDDEDYYGENYPVPPDAFKGTPFLRTLGRAFLYAAIGGAIGLLYVRFVVPWLAEMIA